jgi:hypothetical protein
VSLSEGDFGNYFPFNRRYTAALKGIGHLYRRSTQIAYTWHNREYPSGDMTNYEFGIRVIILKRRIKSGRNYHLIAPCSARLSTHLRYQISSSSSGYHRRSDISNNLQRQEENNVHYKIIGC